MRIDALTLEGFRNYDRQALTFHHSCNVIYGENAQGKTNLLEAMVYLSCGKSPRARADRELIGFDRDKARILGQMFTRDREFRTEVELFRGRRRKASVNGVPAKNNAALSDVLHTVLLPGGSDAHPGGGCRPPAVHGPVPLPAAAPVRGGTGGIPPAL